MYLEHFSLLCKPFSLAPDPRFFYESRRHRTGLAILEYALVGDCDLCLLTGDVGTGKTTLVRCLLERTDQKFEIGTVLGTHGAYGSMQDWLPEAFGLQPVPAGRLFALLGDHFKTLREQGLRPVLVIDEAQNLDQDALEATRVLTNMNTLGDQLIQVVLVGQPELRERLRAPQLRQLVQRIAGDHELERLTRDEVSAYVTHRLQVAGGRATLFTDDAVLAVAKLSLGVPRVVNLLCDFALLYAYADGRDRVDAACVLDVYRQKSRGGLYWLRGRHTSRLAS